MKIRNIFLSEGFDEEGTPDLKYYAFDWDDNIMFMPTIILLKDENGKKVGMSTEDFAEYRGNFNKSGDAETPFEYNDHMIVSLSDDSFINFGVKGDKQFIIDSLLAKPGPSWSDFVEAINSGSIFSIITARGHTPNVLKEACYNLIASNHNGISSNELVKNLEKYRDLAGEGEMSKKDMIKEYLDLCRFYPVTYGEGSATNPEEGKNKAADDFEGHIRDISSRIKNKAFLKKVIINQEPQIGFSDDDKRNVDTFDVKRGKKNNPDSIWDLYLTAGGVKKRV